MEWRGRVRARWLLAVGFVLQGGALAVGCGSHGASQPAAGGSAGNAEASGGGPAAGAFAQAGETSAAGARNGAGGAGAGSSGAGAGASDADAGASGSGTEPPPVVVELAAGDTHACALFSDGRVKCWGDGGLLGYGNRDRIGDDELPSAVGFVSVTTKPGVRVKHLTAAGAHTCALLSDGTVSCWGRGADGSLGYGNTESIGDDEVPSSAGVISVSSDPSVTVTEVVAGLLDTCAVLSDGSLKCWGFNMYGTLGQANGLSVGVNNSPSSAPAIAFPNGLKALGVAAAEKHTCAFSARGLAYTDGASVTPKAGPGCS